MTKQKGKNGGWESFNQNFLSPSKKEYTLSSYGYGKFIKINDVLDTKEL